MPTTSGTLSNALTLVAVGCTVLMTGLVVRRELFMPKPALPESLGPPVQVDDWASVVSAGQVLGDSNGAITIVTFSDFECPWCRRFAMVTMPAINRRFPGQVRVLYRHWPLPNHSSAYPAALAAECAAEQGLFETFHNKLYAEQDSLGSKSLLNFAREAGIADLATFEKCIENPATAVRIEADVNEARRVGATGTPSILVDGKRLRGKTDSLTMFGLIEAALRKRTD